MASLESFLPVCFSDLSLFGGVGRLKIQSRPYRRFPNQGDRPAHVPRFVYRPLFYIACTHSLGTGYLRMLTHARAILLILAPFSSWLLLFMNGLANSVTVQLFRNAYRRADDSLRVAYSASVILRSAACYRRVPPINLVTFIDIRWFQALDFAPSPIDSITFIPAPSFGLQLFTCARTDTVIAVRLLFGVVCLSASSDYPCFPDLYCYHGPLSRITEQH